MPNALDIKRYKVDDCILKLYGSSDVLADGYWSKEEASLPVTSFTATYDLNGIPTCSITPAFGRNMAPEAGDSTPNDAASLLQGAGCELILKLTFPGSPDPKEITIIRGIVSSVSMQDSSLGEGRRVSVKIEVAHIGSILGGAASSTYVLEGAGEPILDMNIQLAVKSTIARGGIELLGIANLANLANLATSEEAGVDQLKLAGTEAL